MKRALLTLTIILSSILSSLAYDCEVDGIYYNLNKVDKTASVTYEKEKKESYKESSITIPQEITYKKNKYKVTSIGEYAFYDCSSLSAIALPNSVTAIGDCAFLFCSSLSTIPLPNSLTTIGNFAFSYSSLRAITLPNSVTSIGDNVFYKCSSLSAVTLPNSLTSILGFVFAYCSSLTAITLPHSLTSIGPYAFEYCESLNTITLPNSITSIDNNAFVDSAIKEIVITPDMNRSIIPKKYDNLVKVDYKSIDEYIAYKPFMSWEEYYAKRHKKNLPTVDKEDIARIISNDIEQWQKKGEFESTAHWTQRVNEKTRTQRIDSLKAVYSNKFQAQQNEYKQEYEDLQQRYEFEYKAHYDKVSAEYISGLVEEKNKDFKKESFELKPYDADNQSFLINAGSFGDVLLPVPATDAPSFKDNWNSIKNNIKPTFVFDGKDAVLSKLTFSNGGKDYVYDSHTEAKYAVADIKYNFAPVKVDDVDFDIKDLDISAPAIAQANVGHTVAKQSENVSGLSKKTVEVEHKSISAGNGGGGGTLTKSDVDVSIPRVAGSANNTFALVIANENYRREGSVAYAQNDGKIFAEYLKSTLGLPEKNVQLCIDASLGDIKHGVDRLSQICNAFGSDAKVIVYYAGHGIPDEKNGDAYLLPVDGYGSNVSTAYSIKELYETLGNLPSRQTLLLMDACFSGAQRDGSMMASNARGVRIKPKDNQVSGNLIVLSATQGDETAYPYEEQQHGMFTYFLLKKLKEGKRNVTLGDLADYVITNVKRTSILNNDKLQTPTVSVAPAIAPSWKSLRLSE